MKLQFLLFYPLVWYLSSVHCVFMIHFIHDNYSGKDIMKNFSTVSKTALFRILNPSIISIPNMPGKRQVKKIEKYREKYKTVNYITKDIPVYDLKIVLAQFCGEQYLKKIQLQDQREIFYPDIEKINRTVADIHNRPVEKVARYSPFKEREFNILPEGRKKHNRASKMTIMTYIALNMLITDTASGIVENVTLSRIASIVGTTRNTVQRSLNWLRENDFIYSDCYFAGIFDVTLLDSTSECLYKRAEQGGKGFLRISVELFNYIKNLEMGEIRVILSMLYYMPDKEHKKTIVSADMLRKLLPPYISFQTAYNIFNNLNNKLELTAICNYKIADNVIELSTFTGHYSYKGHHDYCMENSIDYYIENIKSEVVSIYGFNYDSLNISTCIVNGQLNFKIHYENTVISTLDMENGLGIIYDRYIDYDSETATAALSVILRINNTAWTEHYGWWCGTRNAPLRFIDSPILSSIRQPGSYYDVIATSVMRYKGISIYEINTLITHITNYPNVLKEDIA